MSSPLVQQYQKKLHQLYSQVNTQNANHITKEQLKEWLRMCLNDQDISQNSGVKQLSLQIEEGFEFWVDSYLREVCSLEPQNIERLQFKQEEVMEFFSWLFLTQLDQQAQQQQQQQQEMNNEQQHNTASEQQLQHNVSKVSQNKNSPTFKNNNSKLSQKHSQKQHQSPKPNHHKEANISQSIDYTKDQLKQQANQFSSDMVNSQPVQKVNQFFNPQSKQPNSKDQSTSLPQQDDRYKQYLQTIFEHYCKINFGLTKDNTFQNMQKNVSIITMNKFMIFSNDFELNILIAASLPKENNQKPSKIQIRNLLMEIFKKNSAFHKEMNFEQFLQALQKIGQTCFAKLKQAEENSQIQQEPKTKFSFQMVKMIKYMEISSSKQFRQKMTKFNINFSLKFNKQLQEKKQPINYKFKFEAEENAKKLSQQQLLIQLPNNNKPPGLPSSKRNIVLREGEQNLNRPPKHSLEMAKPPLNPKMSTPNMVSLHHQNHPLNLKDKKINSNKNISSHHKLGSNQPNNRQDRNIIPFSQPAQKVTRQSLEKLRTPSSAYEGGLQGYANIHMAKKGLLPIDQSKNAQSGMRKKGDFQLNNVIEEARKQATQQDPRVYYDYLDSRSGRAMSNISASKPLSQYSRDPASNQSYRHSRNDQELDLNPTEAYQKLLKNNRPDIPLPMKNSSRVNSVHNELQGLIDFNESDEDEYLDQHLKKEKENDTEITVRVQKKISSFNVKT